MTIDRLDWDSNFFNFPIGKLTLRSSSDFNLDSFKNAVVQFQLVYVFSKEKLNFEGLNLVDQKVIFHQKINKNFAFNSPSTLTITSFDSALNNIDQLKKLAIESGVYSRFNLDKNFKNGEFEKLYLEWLNKSVQREIAFDIVVAIQDNKIVGFTTLGNKTATLADIGLVCVAAEARGLGIGTALISESILRAKNKGFKEIQVVTQLDNTSATNLYQKAGFTIQDITNIYHFWNL